jgi:hypothetical protein
MAESALPDSGTAFGERVRRRLREEQIIWITTVGMDGHPTAEPGRIPVPGRQLDPDLQHGQREPAQPCRRPAAGRPALRWRRNWRRHRGFCRRGAPRRADDIPPPHENYSFLAKYGDSLLRVSDSAEEFGQRFPVPLRIEIARTRGL